MAYTRVQIGMSDAKNIVSLMDKCISYMSKSGDRDCKSRVRLLKIYKKKLKNRIDVCFTNSNAK